ncbi:hypothetical protein EUX98_g9199 [Antrodiella citrinella]|uniref:Uncharacterized protein n=1 Tax=Antrodiella citrinella TaxID=2447956 RepID=A0A4S4LYN6_9APHY|nr:hypothetical protein EUX98_g9199 [Antrodiella citrinella]
MLEEVSNTAGYVETLEKEVESTKKDLEIARERNEVLAKKGNTLRMRVARAPSQQTRAIDVAVEEAVAEVKDQMPAIVLKGKGGIIPENSRAMIRDMVAAGVPATAVNGTIHVIAKHQGLNVVGSVSPRSVSRNVLEGGVASEIQVAEELNKAEGMCTYYDVPDERVLIEWTGATMSGDGTTHRHGQYESRHVTIMDAATSKPVTLTLGIESAVNHTADKQTDGWKNIMQGFVDVANNRPSVRTGSDPLITTTRIAAKFTGVHSDHAQDQKKNAKNLEAWKKASDREVRGEEIMKSLPSEELLPMLCDAVNSEVTAIGGREVWDALPQQEMEAHAVRAYQKVCAAVGQKAYEAMTQEDKDQADLFITAGCCMHKDLNTVKGGNERMMGMWKREGLTPPLVLPNRDNAVACRPQHRRRPKCMPKRFRRQAG